MPRQNRVTPFGDIVAVPQRGTLMGNRGVLHDADGHIRRRWQLTRWIICVLAFKDRRRPLMTPGRYTELFFLDEATALAAGHRPCAECQRGRFDGFRQAWREVNGGPLPTAVEIDARLHAERITSGGSQRTFLARVDDLPDGVFLREPGQGEGASLLWRGALLVWSAGGYTIHHNRSRSGEVEVLTPEAIVQTIRHGYVPDAHPSANALVG